MRTLCNFLIKQKVSSFEFFDDLTATEALVVKTPAVLFLSNTKLSFANIITSTHALM